MPDEPYTDGSAGMSPAQVDQLSMMLGEMSAQVSNLGDTVHSIHDDIQKLQTKHDALSGSMSMLSADVAVLKNSCPGHRGMVDAIRVDVDALKHERRRKPKSEDNWLQKVIQDVRVMVPVAAAVGIAAAEFVQKIIPFLKK